MVDAKVLGSNEAASFNIGQINDVDNSGFARLSSAIGSVASFNDHF